MCDVCVKQSPVRAACLHEAALLPRKRRSNHVTGLPTAPLETSCSPQLYWVIKEKISNAILNCEKI